jgi:hypothetical protein
MRLRSVTIALLLCSGCGGAAAVRPSMPTVDEAMHAAADANAKCSSSPARRNPLVLEWPATDRATLDAKLGDGIVAVLFEGCELKVLRSCQVPGYAYAYRGVSKSTDGFHVANDDELFAKLPVGAASLAGELHTSRAIDVNYTSVGVLSVEPTRVARGDLQGDCAGATHFIRAVTVGAFGLTSGTSAAGKASAGAGNIGAGGGSSSSVRALRAGGSLDLCKGNAQAREPGCDVSVQLELIGVDPSPTPALAIREASKGTGEQGPAESLAKSPTMVADAMYPSLIPTKTGWMLFFFDELKNHTREVRSMLLGPQGAPQKDSGAPLARASGFIRAVGAVRSADRVLATWKAEKPGSRTFQSWTRWLALDGTPTSAPIEMTVHDDFSNVLLVETTAAPLVLVRNGINDHVHKALVDELVFQHVDDAKVTPGGSMNLGDMHTASIVPIDAGGRHGVIFGEGPCAGTTTTEHLCRHVARWGDEKIVSQVVVPGERTQIPPFVTSGETQGMRLLDGRIGELRVNKQGCAVFACGNLEWAVYAPDLSSYRQVKTLTRDDAAVVFRAVRTPAGIAIAWMNASAGAHSDVSTHLHVGVIDDDGKWVMGPLVSRHQGFVASVPSVATDGRDAAVAWTWCDKDDDCRVHFTRFDNTDELVKE